VEIHSSVKKKKGKNFFKTVFCSSHFCSSRFLKKRLLFFLQKKSTKQDKKTIKEKK
jgi:hypothetical protein